MDSAKSQLADKLQSATNVLVTVSRNPSVDQLAALLGMTLFLNKIGKHAAAVFSGEVPSTIEFLQPEETIEKNTDSLRDFIIALDKSKADKLRYKVEDNVVRIFITPYKTSISQDDLDFSQGDFNVDAVVALGVKQQEDLDDAITSHGRILHDATVASLTTTDQSDVGTINWHDPQASSLSELVTELAQAMKADTIDEQIATALLTGIVAETERFSNDKTSAQTMSASAALMAAGANQQLVASKLEQRVATPTEQEAPEVSKSEDGTLAIDHNEAEEPEPTFELPEPQEEETPAESEHVSRGPKLVTEPPTLGGTLTANTQSEGLDPVTDPFSLPRQEEAKILTRDEGKVTPPSGQVKPEEPVAQPAEEVEPTPAVTSSTEPAPAEQIPEPETKRETKAEPETETQAGQPQPNTGGTLADLEVSVHSSHANTDDLDAAREEVNNALKQAGTNTPEPVQALNAQPLVDNLHPDTPTEQPPAGPPAADPSSPDPSLTDQIPGLTIPHDDSSAADQGNSDQQKPAPPPQVIDPNAPPPVPPPIPFQFNGNHKQDK